MTQGTINDTKMLTIILDYIMIHKELATKFLGSIFLLSVSAIADSPVLKLIALVAGLLLTFLTAYKVWLDIKIKKQELITKKKQNSR